jgi:hypothetical protein
MSAIATAIPESIVNELTTGRKIMIGGLGALTPILLNLVVVDLKTIFASMTALVLLGYLIRVVLLFYLGGLVAYFHKEEKKALKLFELGIVAPALLTALINGANVQNANLRAGTTPAAATAGLMDFFIPTAYAQTKDPEVKTYKRPEEGVAAQLWRGLSGSRDEQVWFVVAGTYKTSELQKAHELVQRIKQSSPDFNPEIYGNDQYYAVVIGAGLSRSEANARMQKATEAKIPTYGEVYLYNPWETK